MKITVRLIVSLVLAAALVASVFSYVQVQNERDRLTQELDVRASILAESLQESVKELLRSNSPAKLKRFVDRFGNRESLVGVAVFDSQGVSIAASPGLSSAKSVAPTHVWKRSHAMRAFPVLSPTPFNRNTCM